MTAIAPGIFKAYDIRGLYPGELDAEVYRRIGRAFVDYLGASKIAVGRDCRLSSPELATALVAGARAQGASVTDIGVVSTDMLAYGGLTGSRVPRVFEADARRRLEAIGRLKQRRSDLRVYAFSTILGQAPANESDADRQTRAQYRNRRHGGEDRRHRLSGLQPGEWVGRRH